MINEEQVKGNINSTERQLLYDIRELLKEVLVYLKPTVKIGGIPQSISKMKSVTTSATGFVTLCPFCGKDHKQKGIAGVCARKRKKELI